MPPSSANPKFSRTNWRTSCARAGAKSDAGGQFLTAKSEPSEREVGDIEAANEKDYECAAPQEIQSLLDVGGQHVLERFDDGVESGIDQEFLELGHALEVFVVQSVDLCLSLLGRAPGLQTPDVEPVVTVMQGFSLRR